MKTIHLVRNARCWLEFKLINKFIESSSELVNKKKRWCAWTKNWKHYYLPLGIMNNIENNKRKLCNTPTNFFISPLKHTFCLPSKMPLVIIATILIYYEISSPTLSSARLSNSSFFHNKCLSLWKKTPPRVAYQV